MSTDPDQAAIADNRENWNDRADVHAASTTYDVAGLLAHPMSISQVVRNDLEVLWKHLPDTGIRGRSLLHLQCHIGTDTLSWARLGAAEVHGLDLSPTALHHARRIATADGRSITWVEGDVRVASTLIHRCFEVIVTSVGTIVWLPELTEWAHSIYDLLEPGGLFLIRDDHPLVAALDEDRPWRIANNYLAGGGVRTYHDDSTYTDDSAGRIRHVTNHQWHHDIAEVITALVNANLTIRAVSELPYIDWPALPGLQPCAQGWQSPPHAPRIPLTYAILARKEPTIPSA